MMTTTTTTMTNGELGSWKWIVTFTLTEKRCVFSSSQSRRYANVTIELKIRDQLLLNFGIYGLDYHNGGGAGHLALSTATVAMILAAVMMAVVMERFLNV